MVLEFQIESGRFKPSSTYPFQNLVLSVERTHKMPLSWNEIRSNAFAFSKEWKNASREDADAKSFWDDFFRIFGLMRRHVASFEEPVKSLKGTYGFIDLFWKGVLIVEHKSLGRNLSKAHTQAMEYIQSLQREQRGEEVPRYLIVSDFAQIALHDLEEETSTEFPLAELHERIHLFGFIPGYKQHRLESDDPINLKAVAIMGELHDSLEAGGYAGHHLERMLVRVLFCLFAEDTGIFERNAFELYLNNHTKPDGSDLGSRLAEFFQVLNTPAIQRQKNLQEELASLPYVNGELFSEFLGFAAFNRDMRNSLISCTKFDWSRISPAVFGALFQSVMEPIERRQQGAHYTSERDILKTIGPLFLDELKEDLEKAGVSKPKLKAFMERLGKIKLLDPACGCGNFLVISYRELRQLELEALKRFHGIGTKKDLQQMLDTSVVSIVDVDQLYGIEIEEWPARIAEVAIWLMDHQMNLRISEVLGQYYVRLPLIKSPHILHGNALQIDWNDVVSSSECTYVLGNPPFVGSRWMSDDQRADMAKVMQGVKNAGLLDLVTAWYIKASEYVNDSIRCAFVSTNSISQGEQVGVLWSELFKRGMKLHFAHRTFQWKSEARGGAHVHVVIEGFGKSELQKKLLFDYENDRLNPSVIQVRNISPYLVEGDNAVILNRSTPLCEVPKMVSGNQPVDNGNYFFTPEERNEFIELEPRSKPYFRPWLGGEEFINGIDRYCLWLGDVPPEILRQLQHCMQRVEQVRAFRTASKRTTTVRLAQTPTRFGVEVLAKKPYLALPQVSSERRYYIPIAFLDPKFMVGEKLRVVADASKFHFGVLTSSMHMAWMRQVTGRLESRYQYSAKLVYNNFPWPSPSESQIEIVEQEAQCVLDARASHPDSTLADLYDPRSMPSDLAKSHARLDRAVEKCYRAKPFPSERSRVEFLFELHQKLATPLTRPKKKSRKK
jgi:hypothetical protein